MLLPGTLPSRRDLQALTGDHSGANGEETGRADDGAASRLEAVEQNIARLDEYLCAGLGVRDVVRRDALLKDAMLLYVRDAVADEPHLDEADLFRALRRAACAFGLASREPLLPLAGSKTLRNSIRAVTQDVRTALARHAAYPDERATIEMAAIVAVTVVMAPVWYIEPELPQRLLRAYAICAAATNTASSLAPCPLALDELNGKSEELARAYLRVWHALPASTVEARVLWELGLSVDDIARVLDVTPPAVDTALLQVLTATKVFNILVGREPASQLEHGRANRAYERLMRDLQ